MTVVSQWIKDVVDHGRDLSKWEEQFIESISDQFDRTHRLSERQIEVLERIWEEKAR
jgi:hypothetical protein